MANATTIPGPDANVPVGQVTQPMVTGEVDLRALHQRLNDLAHTRLSPQELLKEIGGIVRVATGAHHVAWYGRLPFDDSEETPLHVLSSSLPEESDALHQVCLNLARDASRRQAPCTKLLPRTTWAQLASVPVPHVGDQALVALFSTTTHGLAPSLLVLELAATRLALNWYAQDAERTNVAAERLATITELLAHLESANGLASASQLLATKLSQHLGAERVIVGIVEREGRRCEITAVSGLDSFDANDESLRSAGHVLVESLARDRLSRWPCVDETNRFALIAHRQYAESNRVATLVSLPLRTSQGAQVGAILISYADQTSLDPSTESFLESSTKPLAAALYLQRRAERGWLISTITELRDWMSGRRGGVASVLGVIGIGALALPFPFTVHSTCTIEPVLRRFVAAPFDGPLEKSLIAPGDIVTKDQVLARMDGREVRWELAGVRAELQRAIKERAGHMAIHDFGKAKVAEHEVARLTLRTQLLEERDAHLEIRSPIDGVVVSGDMSDSEGVPLRTGQTLFEVAPLDKMEVEVRVPERDVAYVTEQQSVTIHLEAFPQKKISASIQRLHPRAEIVDDENVFVAEVTLDHPDPWLRPGMHGTARIDAGHQPLGWILFRRPWAALLTWLGW